MEEQINILEQEQEISEQTEKKEEITVDEFLEELEQPKQEFKRPAFFNDCEEIEEPKQAVTKTDVSTHQNKVAIASGQSKIIITLIDSFAPAGLAKISKKEKTEFKLDSEEKEALIEALSEYLATLADSPSPLTTLIIAVIAIYGAKLL